MAEKIVLNELMEFLGNAWQFNGKNYRGFDELNERGKRLFPLKHSILHISKSLGKLSTEAEKADHGDEADKRQLRIVTAKLVATSLHLAVHLDISPGSLEALISAAVRGELS